MNENETGLLEERDDAASTKKYTLAIPFYSDIHLHSLKSMQNNVH